MLSKEVLLLTMMPLVLASSSSTAEGEGEPWTTCSSIDCCLFFPDRSLL
jgi:hypothetical protein